MSALGDLADIRTAKSHVRFIPEKQTLVLHKSADICAWPVRKNAPVLVIV
jgi:hypothetical protein